ncbi:DUF692 domain-containing protein [Sandaracinus amylolyticus]|uniref:Uncharacterized protein n=1 Tax=Sandaracinus amylolyticus TaxID=927083 RepID=A0A0F6W0F9_9BACT|nr:DUF692 family multinuclear iron-containing protein [Sandaracinus amylolyticus]AKF04312.1 Hypothetical protein DB32_001461 [Sandaracinus amylolyticus]
MTTSTTVSDLSVPQLGVGLQFNPEIYDWFPFAQHEVDAFEVLLDAVMAPLDGRVVMAPGAAEQLEELAKRAPLVAHSNYGCDFGFDPLESTPAVRRHVPIARHIGSPWVSNHCFYADASWSDIWSSPLQFSRSEVERVGRRARALGDLYGIPLAHENAAYYVVCPGSEMREAEFLAALVERAGTYLHLDLHNVYTNSVNHPGFDAWDYLATIPLERVIAIHLAGGSLHDGVYHDWHDSAVPEPVWEMLQHVLEHTRVGAVFLEFQGRGHHDATRVLDRERDLDMILADLTRARRTWDAAYGPRSRRTTRAGAREACHGR